MHTIIQLCIYKATIFACKKNKKIIIQIILASPCRHCYQVSYTCMIGHPYGATLLCFEITAAFISIFITAPCVLKGRIY